MTERYRRGEVAFSRSENLETHTGRSTLGDADNDRKTSARRSRVFAEGKNHEMP